MNIETDIEENILDKDEKPVKENVEKTSKNYFCGLSGVIRVVQIVSSLKTPRNHKYFNNIV